MESSRNENTQGHEVEEIEDGIAMLEGNHQEPVDDNLPEQPQEDLSPDSTVIMGPGSSSPILPDTPTTSDEDVVNIQDVPRTPSPSLLQDYGDYDVEVIEDVNAMLEEYNLVDIPPGPVDIRHPSPEKVPIDEERSTPIARRTRRRLAETSSTSNEIMSSSSPVSSRTRAAAKRRLEANQTESTPVPSRIKRTHLEKDPSPK